MADSFHSLVEESIQQLSLKNLGNQISGKINPHVLQPVNIGLRDWLLKIFIVPAKVRTYRYAWTYIEDFVFGIEGTILKATVMCCRIVSVNHLRDKDGPCLGCV